MTTSSAFLFSTDFYQKIAASSTATAISMLQAIIGATMPSILPYVPWAMGVLFIGLVIASIKALFGQTGMLGSLLYHVFYFGILGIIIWMKGLEIVFNVYFDLICAIVYRACYWLTGLILVKFRTC